MQNGDRNKDAPLPEKEILHEEEQKEAQGKYLTFLSDGQFFGIPIVHVEQIIGIQEIIRIPELPAYVKGVINLRGSIIPVIDIRVRLGRGETSYTERTCIIITKLHEEPVGIIVDEVREVAYIGEKDISPPPSVSDKETYPYILGVARLNDQVVLLLRTDRILDSSESFGNGNHEGE